MNNKKRNKKSLIFILILLISLGYAYLNSNLQINGTTGIAGNTWDVHFENVVPSSSNTVTPTIAPVANPQDKVTELTYSVKFNKPGDIYEFNVDVVNAGTIDAMIESFTSKIKIGDGEEQEASPSTIPSYLNYYITYEDGVVIKNNQLLNASSSETIKVYLEYKEDISESELALSAGNTISFEIDIKYTQATEEAIDKPVRLNCTYEGELVNNATYTNGQYSYQYNSETDGWGVHLVNSSSTDPVTTPLCSTINGKHINNMSGMFYNSNASSIDLSSFDTSHVTDMAGMFNSVKVTELDLSSFDTRNVTSIENMFVNSNEITELDLSNFNTSKIIAMGGAFSAMEKLEKLNLSKWDFSNPANRLNSTISPNTLSKLKWLDVSNAKFGTDMTNDFSSSSLEYLNLSGVDTFKTKNMTQLFRNTKMTSIDISDFDMQNVEQAYGMFAYSSIERLDMSNMDTRSIKNIGQLCMKCTNLKYVNLNNAGSDDLSGMADMLYSSNNVEEIHMKNFNFGRLDYLGSTQGPFYNKQKLKVVDLDGAKMSRVVSLFQTFYNCIELEELDLSNIYAPKVITGSASTMFYNDVKLNYLDISGFDFSAVTTYNSSSMFTGVPATTVYVKNQANVDALSSLSHPSTMTFVVKP